jgi:hypothetical protein
MGAVITTTIVALAAVLGASLPTYLSGRQRREEKVQDWARQDAVAAQAAEAARLLEERQNETERKAAEVARQLQAANKLVTQQNAVTNGKLAQIHELVNSNLTSQMEEGHASLVQQLVLMREVVRLNHEAGRAPESPALAAIAAIESRVAELGAQLRDRAQATAIANAQVE